MIVKRLSAGANGRNFKYAVCADATETDGRPQEVARFDSLELAALVIRYLRGAGLCDSDERRVKDALKKVDMPTDQSRHIHKAE